MMVDLKRFLEDSKGILVIYSRTQPNKASGKENYMSRLTFVLDANQFSSE